MVLVSGTAQVLQRFIARASTKWRIGSTKWEPKRTQENKLLLKHPEAMSEVSLISSVFKAWSWVGWTWWTSHRLLCWWVPGTMQHLTMLLRLGLPIREVRTGVQKFSFPNNKTPGIHPPPPPGGFQGHILHKGTCLPGRSKWFLPLVSKLRLCFPRYL